MKGFKNISAEAYFRDPCPIPSLSSSVAHEMVSKSPEHAYRIHPKLGALSRESTAAQDLGSIIHPLVLGADFDSFQVLDFPDFRTNAAKEARDAARAQGKVPVLEKKFRPIASAAEEIRRRIRDTGVELGGVSELSAFWQTKNEDHSKTIQCRARLDHWDEEQNTIFDLKTTDSAHPDAIKRKCETYGYALQAAMYRAGVRAITGRMPKWYWIFAEKEPPYSVVIARPSESMADLGRLRFRRAVELWANCTTSGKWPGYADSGAIAIEASPWALEAAHAMERMAA